MQYPRKQKSRYMSAHERIKGWVFFTLFVLVFPILMGIFQRFIGGILPIAESSVIYYLLSITIIFLLFWTYLKHNFYLLLDHLSENFFSIFYGLAGAGLLQIPIMLISYPVNNPNTVIYPEQFLLSPLSTVLILVGLMPVVEEVLFRGLIFDSIRPCNLPLAWVVSCVAYCLFSVWQFIFFYGQTDLRYLVLAIQYLPMSTALTWCYGRGGSIWSSVILHAAFNAISLFFMVR